MRVQLNKKREEIITILDALEVLFCIGMSRSK